MSTTLGPIVPCFTASSSCLLSTMRVLDPPFMGCLPFATSLARSRRSAAGPCKIPARSELRRHPNEGSLAYWCTAFKRAERRGQRLLGGGGGRLVAQAPEALVAPQHRHDIEQRRRGRAAGERGAERLRHLPELEAARLGEAAHRFFGRLRGPVGERGEARDDAGDALAPAIGDELRGLVVEPERSPGIEVGGAVEELDQGLRPLLEAGHGAPELVAQLGREGLAEAARGTVLGQDGLERRHELLVGGPADIVAVEVLELSEIEPRRRAADLVEGEGVDHLVRREDLLVAVAPAEPDEVVAQRRRQIAKRAVGIDAERPVALRELRAVGTVDERDMRHLRNAPAERLIDLRLPRGVGEMVVAA